jgi:hypothetical protein
MLFRKKYKKVSSHFETPFSENLEHYGHNPQKIPLFSKSLLGFEKWTKINVQN